ncbi:hypothetical protein ABW19_dt0205207 [Dactylella cylindrospora]|nr:hypothetical protein ABW19_dt0205207 [Dactylella cylindrospora]
MTHAEATTPAINKDEDGPPSHSEESMSPEPSIIPLPPVTSISGLEVDEQPGPSSHLPVHSRSASSDRKHAQSHDKQSVPIDDEIGPIGTARVEPPNDYYPGSFESEASRKTPQVDQMRGGSDLALEGSNDGDAAVPAYLSLAPELGTMEVFSFIVNKMIGSGIVTGPAQVLHYSGTKYLALVLWGLGFLYTIVSIIIFVEFGCKFPVTGGELVYLDELLCRGRPLLMVVIFAFQFIFFWNTSTNCIQVARHILLAVDSNLENALHKNQRRAESDQDPYSKNSTSSGNNETVANQDLLFKNQDLRLVGFIALFTLGSICLLHYFSRRAGRITNVGLAAFKVAMVVVLFVQGASYASKHKNLGDWTQQKQGSSWSDLAHAVFAVLFAFQGWENASFVAGEVDMRGHKALKRGCYYAIGVVGTLYLLVNVTFLAAFPMEPGDAGLPVRDGFAARYSGYTQSAIRGWAALLTLSALGNVLAVTYTCGRVKQMIGQSNILPWSRIWAQESRFNTPSGGLLLHFIWGGLLIMIALSIPNAYGLPGFLQSYSHGLVALAVTYAFCKYCKECESTSSNYQLSALKSQTVRWLLVGLSFLFNIAMTVLPLASSDVPDSISGRILAVICSGSAFFATAYYFCLFPSSKWEESAMSWRGWSLLRLIRVTWEIREVDDTVYTERWREFKKTTRYLVDQLGTSKEAFKEFQERQFGKSRQMVYYELEYLGTSGDTPGKLRKLVFWLFGGDFTPDNRIYTSPRKDFDDFIRDTLIGGFQENITRPFKRWLSERKSGEPTAN